MVNIRNLKKTLIRTAVSLMLLVGMQPAGYADEEQRCRADIRQLLASYQQALNAGNVDAVVRLYTDDGVFMPSNKPTAVGGQQVLRAYQRVFRELDLDVQFHIDEIEIHGDVAFVLTRSDGQISLLAKDITIQNSSRELFVVRRVDDQWKIYRYMFNEVGE